MRAATGLASGDAPLPRLAELAVLEALEQLAAPRAAAILLYLTPDFAREADTALKAAAKAGLCLQVSGGLVAHPFTEREAILDRSAAAALVLDELPAPRPGQPGGLTYLSHHPAAPCNWSNAHHFGIECAPGPLWNQGRLQEGRWVRPEFSGLATRLDVSHGLQRLGPALEITGMENHQLQSVGHCPALESLRRTLAPEQRAHPALHHLFAIPPAGPAAAIPILEALPDGRLVLARPLAVGTPIAWAIRQPLAAEVELERQLENLARGTPPLFGLMFACIGRGPWFHGGEERNLAAWQTRLGALPLLGAYGDSQICPTPDGGARLLHNTVVTALFSQET